MKTTMLLCVLLGVGAIVVGCKSAKQNTSSVSQAAASPAGPESVVASKNGKSLFVTLAVAKQVAQVGIASGKITRSIHMPARPTGLVLSPDGATLYVTCAAPEGTVAVVDVKSGKLLGKIPVGHWPIGPAISPDGKTLYVCNRFDNNVAVVDLATKKITLVSTTREPFAAVVTPDGKSVFVINHLPNERADGLVAAAVVTAIDTATNETQTIRLTNGATVLRGICVSPDGKWVYATQVHSRPLPRNSLERLCINTNEISIIDAAEKKIYHTVLLGDTDLGAANPWGVACSADGRTICVAHAGTHELNVIDAASMHKKLAELPASEARDVSNILCRGTPYLITGRIPVSLSNEGNNLVRCPTTYNSYISKGWCFVVATINPTWDQEQWEITSEGLAAPLILRFPHANPVYPLALTGTGDFETEILIYLASDTKMSCDDRLTLRFAGHMYWGALIPLSSYTEPEGFFDLKFDAYPKYPYLCKFKDRLSPAEMSQDIIFSPAKDKDPYREHIVKW